MVRTALVVLVATTTSWTISLPLSFGFVYGDCAPACLGGGICPQLYFCRNAWNLFPAMMLSGFVTGLTSGGIGYAYHAPRRGARARRDRGAPMLKRLLAPFPFVLLGAVFYIILLPGLNLFVGAWALLLATIISVAMAGTAIGFEAIRSRPA